MATNKPMNPLGPDFNNPAPSPYRQPSRLPAVPVSPVVEGIPPTVPVKPDPNSSEHWKRNH